MGVSIGVAYELTKEEQDPWSAVFTPNRINPEISNSSTDIDSIFCENYAYCNYSLPSIPVETTGEMCSKRVSFARLDLFPPLEPSDITSSHNVDSESSFRYVLEITPEHCFDIDDDGYVSHKTESVNAFSTQL